MQTIPKDPPSQGKTRAKDGQSPEKTSSEGALQMDSINFICKGPGSFLPIALLKFSPQLSDCSASNFLD